MTNKDTKPKTAPVRKKNSEPLKLVHLVLLIGYGYVVVFAPNLQTLDSIGPKFLSLALLNLATFLFLFTRKELKNRPEWYYAFFRNPVGIAYTGLIVVSLFSFFKAINILESVLQFSKLFTTFSASLLVSVLVIADKRNIRYLCIAMTLLLIYDGIIVISEIFHFINGKINNIDDIKSVYGNKNMFASAIFVKIPFALWLMIFNSGWLRKIGIFGTLVAFVAVFFLSARAFYLGIFALTILLVLFLIIRFRQTDDKLQLRLTGIYLTVLVGAFLIFSVTQQNLYPQKGSGYAVSVKERLSTITSPDGGGGRLDAWKRSWHAFKENPILGVGVGNWKIATVQEENQNRKDLVFLVHSHNDFIQSATETGLFGGLLFLSIFFFVGLAFLHTIFKDHSHEELILYFLPAFGLFCYGIDAFFNFPHERPEMQSLFALFTGMASALLFRGDSINQDITKINSFLYKPVKINFSETFLTKKNTLSNLPGYSISISYIFGIILIFHTYILYQNFISLKQQLIVRKDIIDGKLTNSASIMINGFPFIPNLNLEGEPIAIQKAQYLMNENHNEEAIMLLKKDKSNPYHPLVAYYISMAYRNQNNLDSSLIYAQKLYEMKPYLFENISVLCTILYQKGLLMESLAVIDNYLSKIKDNKTAWLYASDLYIKTGNIQKATAVIDSAVHYLPSDSLILKQRTAVNQNAVYLRNKILIDSSSDAYKSKKYAEAIRLYSELLIKEPNLYEAIESRALCYYYVQNYSNSIKDLTALISIKPANTPMYNLYNILGTNYYMLGRSDEACRNFKLAADMGDKDGLNNYAKFCK